MKNKFFKYCVFFFTTLITVSNYAQTTDGTRPNIIVILADDLGYADVGFNRDATFPSERGAILTPNIDALANNGVIMKNAHVVHPFCGPSRVALLTGIYPHRIGAQYNLPNNITSTLGVPQNETYFSKILQDSGYNTSAIGKWHLGYEDGKYQPLDRGFDYFFGFLGGGKNYFESIYEDSFYNRQGGSNPVTNEYQDPLQRNRNYVTRNEYSNAPNEDYLTDVLTDNAIDYINLNKGKSDPFFMYLAYNAPHTPLQATDAEISQFKIDNPNFESDLRGSDYLINSDPVVKLSTQAEKDAKIEEFVEARVIYATMTVNMDKNIGRVVDELKKNINDFNNTVIIFLSDNGGYRWSKGADNFPLQQQKGSVLEGGHKVPMFVSWPNKITSSSTYDYQVSSLDIYPTLVDLAGATIPALKKIDGKSFMDEIIAGQKVRLDTEPLYAVRPQNGFQNGGIVSYPWKIVKTGNNGNWRLYNILNDPGESTDVRASEPNAEEIVNDLLDEAEVLFSEFKDVKPAWYDNDGDGSGHIHSFLWNDGTLPGYDRLFERASLALDIEIKITGTNNAIEGVTNGVFTVGFSNGATATEDVEVTYVVGGTATEGTDYTAITRTVTISNGDSSAEINIEANQDSIDEDPETVIITLQSSTSEKVNTTEASINIVDETSNETPPLTAGDIAIVGWKAGSGKLAFMLLKEINATTKVSISNRTWSNSQNEFTGDYSVDDIWTWTPGANFNTGDILLLDADGQVKQIFGNTEVVVGTTSHDYAGKIAETSDGDFDLATNGDGILIFYSEDPFVLPTDANSSAWITGINTALGWGNGGGNSRSELPAALTNGVNANNVGEKQDNGVYTGALSGTPDQLRASINNSANWLFSEDTVYNLWSFDTTNSSVAGNIGTAGALNVSNYEPAKVNIFPNPISEIFTLQLNSTYKNIDIEILSVTGKLIQKRKFKNSNKETLDVSNLDAGIYFIRINADTNIFVDKVLKL